MPPLRSSAGITVKLVITLHRYLVVMAGIVPAIHDFAR